MSATWNLARARFLLCSAAALAMAGCSDVGTTAAAPPDAILPGDLNPDLSIAATPDFATPDLAASATSDLATSDLATSAVDMATSPPLDAAIAAPDLATPAPAMWVTGYYAGYESKLYPVAEIGWNGLTHLAVAFYIPDKVGGIDESLFLDPQSGPVLGHALVDAAHKAGRKALASIGGGGTHDAMAASASNANRAAFTKRILKVVTDYGYDGVDLDWEPINNPADVQPLLELIKGLRAAMPNLLVTLPFGTRNRNLPEDITYLPQLAALLDQINLMSYGMAGSYQGWKSWHSSPLHWNGDAATPTGIDDSVGWVLGAGVPAARLGLGSGFYGLCYTAPVTAPDQALNGSVVAASDGTMSFANIQSTYYSANAAQWDAKAMVPYLTWNAGHGPQKCTFVTYEDPMAIAAKAAYAKSKGLGGTIIWTINQGYISGAAVGKRNPLLDAMEAGYLK